MRRLSVFAGGCTAEAAATVCGIDGEPVEHLAGLVHRSLVQLQYDDPGLDAELQLAVVEIDGGELAAGEARLR
ncbi:MAG: hypothetical protein ACRD2C_14315, partial [Acidimicrobiales bacterium]